MTERSVNILKKAINVLFPRNQNSNGEIVLGRLPAEIRHQIWEAPSDQVRDLLSSINKQLEAQGIAPIIGHEFKDAIEGNEYMQKYRNFPSTH